MSTYTSVPPTSALVLDCLGNIDIASEILQYLERDTRERYPLADVAAVALSCRALSEPAQDILWRNLTSIIPLLKLLPSFVEVDSSYVLLRPLSAPDFIRFDTHAKRVRSFDCTADTHESEWSRNYDIHTIDVSVFIHLAHKHQSPILPHLRRLHMSSRAQASLSAVLFLGPQLHCIHFDFDGGGEEKSIGLTSVVSLATHSLPAVVEELTLTGWFPPMVTDLIPRFSNLRRLKVDNTNVEFEAFLLFLPAISHSMRLTSLVLRWAHSLSGRQIDRLPLSAPLLLPVGAFPALKHLDVTGDFESIRQLVSTLDSSQITTLSMNFDSGPRSFRYGRDSGIREWRLLFDWVSERWGSSLERISIDTGNHHGRAKFEELLHGFCEVRNLREFRLLGQPAITIQERDIETLAVGLPRIEILAIGVVAGRDANSVQFPPPNCLLHLVTHCSSLIELEISLNLDGDIGTENLEPLKHGLKSLVICEQGFKRWGGEKIYAVASFFDGVFPRLASVRGTQSYISFSSKEAQAMVKQWADVHRWVKSFQGDRGHTGH
ncbi:hypothetical protein B0H13DRAFT_2520880 [Mycena leptocephala]|nr:hypothetical protein B0H13DRAFT_2520880 [Mycena leptocephala]